MSNVAGSVQSGQVALRGGGSRHESLENVFGNSATPRAAPHGANRSGCCPTGRPAGACYVEQGLSVSGVGKARGRLDE